MKSRFTKTILVYLVISLISMVCGFCIFPKINMAETAVVDHGCGGAQLMEKDSTQQTLSGSTNHDQPSLLPCCIDGRHAGVISVIQSVESGQSISIAFLPQNQLVIPFPRIVFTGNTSLSPPNFSLIKSTVLRL